ncbi:hypothetical protein CSC2_17240 [Clostridium zeae]|uniref:STAS domain-containing protein n=1 Tax=Clostridium zeae TaxID=2759022 RepID=A0ABQ1E8Y0_9CLOT|nr:hypothetical protein [Clostridium zeae]GFZ31198.1 hypothetical protein CSC2_17240 [Clostridium zeae]
MYYYFKYYKKKGIIRNIIKGYIGNEELTYMIKEYIDVIQTMNTHNKILVMDVSDLELVKSEVSDTYCEFLRNTSKEEWTINIIIMPKSIIGSYQIKKFIKNSGINPILVNNSREAINVIKNYKGSTYQNCI